MINLAGLSAAYPGYMAAEDTAAKTQQNQVKAREAAIKLLGAQVAGSALAGQAPPGGYPGPQAPPPGQASVPAPKPPGVQPSLPPAAATAPQGAPAPPVPNVPAPAPAAPAAQPGATPEAAAGGGKLSLAAAVAQILKTSPGVANHPEVLLSALSHMDGLGLLDPEAASKVAETNKLPTLQKVGAVRQALSPPNPNVPPVSSLKPDTVTTFANGQKWTLDPTGQPKQVQ